MNDRYSYFAYLRADVPQGILSPLLVSIFINSIINFITLPFHFYADDLQIYVTASINEIHSAIAISNLWRRRFGLSINADKFQIALIGSRQHLSKTPISSLSLVVFGGI